MKKQNLIQFATLALVLVACSKSGTLNTKAPVIGNRNHANPNAVAGGALTPAQASLTGKLTPLSESDTKELKSSLVFADTANPGESDTSTQGVGNPAFFVAKQKNKPQVGFVKQSNVTFRAIKKIPSVADAITKITQFKLKLHGVYFYNDGTATTSDEALAKQVLCIVDKQICAGGKIDSADANVNNLWKSAKVNEYALATMNQFKTAYTMKDKVAKIYQFSGTPTPTPVPTTLPALSTASVAVKAPAPSAKPGNNGNRQANPTAKKPATPVAAKKASPTIATPVDLEIDLQKAFGILDIKDLPQWIIDNSTVYDTINGKDGNYRKFRFELGNNLYAESGELVLEFTPDTRVPLPTDYATAAGKAKNGDWDEIVDADYKPGTQIDDSEIAGLRDYSKNLSESMIGFDNNTDGTPAKISDASMANVKKLATLLIQYQDSIHEIHFNGRMDAGTDATTSRANGKARGTLLQTALSSLQVSPELYTAIGSVAKKSLCATSGACEQDHVMRVDITLKEGIDTDTVANILSDLSDGFTRIFGVSPSASSTANPVVATTP